MAFGATILCMAALLGMHVLLIQFPSAFIGLKVSGGLYLLWLAYHTWRGATAPLRVEAVAPGGAGGRLRHFWLAAATMLSNPKAAVQYGVIFAAVLPTAPSTSVVVALPPSVFALEASWYLIVAILLSAPGPRSAYLGTKPGVDRTAGVVLGLLGIRLILMAR
jgi:threonine/homoserine/homoserine lactone efflux protein